MKIGENVTEAVKGARKEMADIGGIMHRNRGKILSVLAGLGILGVAANYFDNMKEEEWYQARAQKQEMKYKRENQLREELGGRQIDREKHVDQGAVAE